MGIPFLGNHFVIINFLIAPLYAVFPSPLTLLYLQSFLLAGGAWFVYRLGLRLLDGGFALSLAFVYLLYPALLFVALFEFHPVALAVFFLLGALEAFERQSLRPFLIFLSLALTCQEDVSLVVAALGVYGVLRRRPLVWVLTPLGLGISWFCVSVFILMPRWNPGTINFSLLYSHLGRTPQEVFGFILFHPLRTVSVMLEGADRKRFILNLLAPLGFLPFLDPKSFLLTLPGFLEQLLSNRSRQHLLLFHYSALLIPFLFFAALQGLRRLLRLPVLSANRRSIQLLLIGLVAVTAVGFGPLGSFGELHRELQFDIMDMKREQLSRKVPPEASVVATFEFLPHLANRRHLYSSHRLYKGLYDLFGQDDTFPRGIDLLLIDFNDPLTLAFMEGTEDADRKLSQFLKGWKIREAFGDLVCFEKGGGTSLIQPVADFSTPQNIHVQIDDAFALLGLTGFSGVGKEGGILPLTFSWECLKPTPKQYGLILEFLDGKKRVVTRNYHSIGYRMVPTFRWKKGERFEETYSLVLPAPAEGERSYELKIACVDEDEGHLVPLEAGGSTTDTISLGSIEVSGG